MRKNYIILICMICIAFMFCNIHAAPTDGTAYAVLTNKGELILFRSTRNYTDGTGKTVKDIQGNEYTGRIWGSIETTNISSTNNSPWYSQRSSIKSVRVASGQTIKPKNCNYWFYKCSNCTSMDLTGLNTVNVTNMSEMFYDCSGLTSLDISNFNTANVTDMSFMFCGCSDLTNLSISFNTGNVTDMYGMFQNCSKLTSLDLSRFNTGNVTTMSYMFQNCSGLASLDLSRFNTANVTNMSYMFRGCSGLTSLDLSSFNTGKVTRMSYMFYGCSSLTSLDLKYFNTGKVTYMDNMFSGCSGLTNLDLSSFNTENVMNMSDMFQNCSKLTSLDLSRFNTGNVMSMGGMFSGCSGLTTLNLSNFNTENATSMGNMFSGCSGLTALNLSSFNTENVISMGGMFSVCSGLTAINLSSFNTENVTSMVGMFSGCSGLTALNLSSFNTENVISMGGMFSGCSGLTALDVSKFNTENVTDMSGMFSGCSGLTNLDLSSFNTENVTNMSGMFSGCSGLTNLDLNNFNTANVTYMGGMFSGCSQLSSVILGKNFSFKGNGTTSCELPSPSLTVPYTGEWIRKDEKSGPYSSAELSNEYNSNMAGEWIWNGTPTKFTVIYVASECTGDMPNQNIIASYDGTIMKNEFKKFNHTFDHWDGSDGNEYQDEQIIPANSFNIGDTLTLTAVFTKNDNHLNMNDGIATLTMHGGEKITLPDLKGGVTYQVWEDMPSGWQQVSQINPAGKIMANETIDSTFTNEYVPGTATFTLMAQNTLDGRIPEDDAFEFTLSSTTGLVDTVTNKQGMVTFRPLTFQTSGTYIYTISEVRGDDDGINYDPHTETITINVTDDGHGNLTATTNQNELPVFENMTKPGTLTLTKKANIETDETFTFEIVLENEYGQPLDEITVLKEE